MKRDTSLEDYFFGAATVGERGQVVIPAEARKKFNINPGDKILVMGHPAGAGVVLCKIDSVREFFAMFLERIESSVAEATKQPNEEQS